MKKLILILPFFLLAACVPTKSDQPLLSDPTRKVPADKLEVIAGTAARFGAHGLEYLELDDGDTILVYISWPDELVGKRVRVTGVFSENLPPLPASTKPADTIEFLPNTYETIHANTGAKHVFHPTQIELISNFKPQMRQ